MLADIGLAALVVSFLPGLYATVASVSGGRRADSRWAESARKPA